MPIETKPTATTPATRHLWIINNEERMRGFALPPAYHKASKTTVPDANPLVLAPGANLVERRRWEALKAAETRAAEIAAKEGLDVPQGEIARSLAEKIPEGTHPKRRPEKAGSPYLVEGPAVANDRAPLEGLEDKQAIEIVGEIRDAEMIERCIRVERRPDVSAALARQRDLVTKGAVGIGQAA